jgi:uncharacterized phiE125 gp8 family phage protein
MHRPVLITPPEILPVSVAEMKLHLRIEPSVTVEDELVTALTAAATSHLDGWTGILGRCLVEQLWRQDYASVGGRMCLPLGPVIEVIEVAGADGTLDAGDYSLITDGGGRSFVELASGVSVSGAVSVTYRAGYPTVPAEAGPPEVPARSTVPEDIKAAIKLFVGAWYENREESIIGTIGAQLPETVATSAILAKYRRILF